MNRQIITENVKSLRTLHFTKGIEPKKQILNMGECQMLRNADMQNNDRGFAINGNPFLWLWIIFSIPSVMLAPMWSTTPRTLALQMSGRLYHKFLT